MLGHFLSSDLRSSIDRPLNSMKTCSIVIAQAKLTVQGLSTRGGSATFACCDGSVWCRPPRTTGAEFCLSKISFCMSWTALLTAGGGPDGWGGTAGERGSVFGGARCFLARLALAGKGLEGLDAGGRADLGGTAGTGGSVFSQLGSGMPAIAERENSRDSAELWRDNPGSPDNSRDSAELWRENSGSPELWHASHKGAHTFQNSQTRGVCVNL